MEKLSVIISIFSAVIAFFSAVGSFIFAKKSSNTADRLVEIEEDRELDKKKARLTAKIERKREQVSGSISIRQWWIFQIENKGHVGARNVEVFIAGMKFTESPFFDDNPEFSAHIGAESEYTYKFKNADFRHKLPLHCLITWEDDSGKQGKWEHSLTES